MIMWGYRIENICEKKRMVDQVGPVGFEPTTERIRTKFQFGYSIRDSVTQLVY